MPPGVRELPLGSKGILEAIWTQNPECGARIGSTREKDWTARPGCVLPPALNFLTGTPPLMHRISDPVVSQVMCPPGESIQGQFVPELRLTRFARLAYALMPVVAQGLGLLPLSRLSNQTSQRSITSEVRIPKACLPCANLVACHYRTRPGRRARFPGAPGFAFFLSILVSFSLQCRAQDPKTQDPNSGAASPDSPIAPAQMLSSYEGQKVSSIEVAGQPNLPPSAFSSSYVQKEGEPFSEQKVDQTAAAIKAAGKFRSVRVQVDPEAEGVRVIYVLQPAIYFGIFKFPGGQQFPYSAASSRWRTTPSRRRSMPQRSRHDLQGC